MRPDHPSDPPRARLALSWCALTYTDVGAGSPTIVALAGLPGTARDWRWMGPELEPLARLIRLELPGFGGSSWPGDHPMRLGERAQIVIEALEALAPGRSR